MDPSTIKNALYGSRIAYNAYKMAKNIKAAKPRNMSEAYNAAKDDAKAIARLPAQYAAVTVDPTFTLFCAVQGGEIVYKMVKKIKTAEPKNISDAYKAVKDEAKDIGWVAAQYAAVTVDPTFTIYCAVQGGRIVHKMVKKIKTAEPMNTSEAFNAVKDEAEDMAWLAARCAAKTLSKDDKSGSMFDSAATSASEAASTVTETFFNLISYGPNELHHNIDALRAYEDAASNCKRGVPVGAVSAPHGQKK